MKIGIIGLGYVGLPLAVALADHYQVYGYDTDATRVSQLNNYIDRNEGVTRVELLGRLGKDLQLSSKIEDLAYCEFYIITVPTPVDQYFIPNLSYLVKASEDVARILSKEDIVVYESTVYPGTTKEICIPILEKKSHLIAEKDFFVGYSPERINPGDQNNTIKTVQKVISANSPRALKKIKLLYESVVEAGTFSAVSIKTAEMAKIVENAQRDVNIAFMNEVSKICHAMEINTQEVLEAAKTKWNFIDFHPGLVGGHCIGVDPYYLIHRAESLKIKTDLLSVSRSVNESMVEYVEEKIHEAIYLKNKNLKHLKVLVLGLSFKPNVPDFRNSKSIQIVEAILKKNKFKSLDIVDPFFTQADIRKAFTVSRIPQFKNYDVCIILTPHTVFSQDEHYSKYVYSQECLVIDIYGAFNLETSFCL